MWGIPEKSMKNVAQRRWPEVRRTLQSKVMAKINFCFYFPLYFTLWGQKNKDTVVWTFFRHDPKGKIVQNAKIDKNPAGSSHGEQLEPKRLTLGHIMKHKDVFQRNIHAPRMVLIDSTQPSCYVPTLMLLSCLYWRRYVGKPMQQHFSSLLYNLPSPLTDCSGPCTGSIVHVCELF